MQIEVRTPPLRSVETDVLVMPVTSDDWAGSPFGWAVSELEDATDGLLTRLRQRGDFTGEVGESLLVPEVAGLAADRLCLVGVGPAGQFNERNLRRGLQTAAILVSTKPRKNVAVALPTEGESAAGIAAETFMVSTTGPGLYQGTPQRHPLQHLLLAAGPDADVDAVSKSAAEGETLGRCINITRELVNRPAADVYPETFADRAAQVARESGLECEVFDVPRLEKEKMRALLAVAQGSDRPARVVVLHYRGGGEKSPTLALCGKGVTFDSGGLSLKPNDSMKDMKGDLAGAATVFGAMAAIAAAKLPLNVIAVVGLVENMISGRSYKLGDVLTARNGTTIEVLNTDAEGRLVLADVLAYMADQRPDRLIDLATLTGSCVVALGEDIAGLFSNDDEWSAAVAGAAKSAEEDVWPMPMNDEFSELLKSDVADCKNVGPRWGGATIAAKFLEKFVAGTPWVHLDIAGPAFATSAKPFRDSGATGAYVRTLVEVARQMAAPRA